jgi:hypothetical protein
MTPPPAVNVVPSDPKATSRPNSEPHRGRGRFQDPAPDTSVDAQDTGIIGSTTLGTARSPNWVARKLKRQSPASVKDPESSKSGDSEDGAIRPQKRAAFGTARNPRVARKLKRQPPAGSIVPTSVMWRKFTLPRMTISHRRNETPILQPVTKVDMMSVNQSAETQPVTLAPPSGPRRSENSF